MAVNSDREEISFAEASLEHMDALYGYAMVLTHDQTEAEDLVQETYFRAIRKVDRLSPDSNLKAWLFVIMRNIRLNQIRHDRNGPRFVDLPNDQEFQRVPASSEIANAQVFFLRRFECAEIKEAINRLPQVYREVIVLRDIEGFSYQEIARMLDCPAGTVMSRLGRARAKLRTALRDWQPKKAARAV